MQNLEYDATFSWSGYNFQGKNAIYTVLDFIYKLYLANKMDTICSFNLELEWVEDFSLVTASGDYVSIHQVKALDTNNLNSYGEAILGLLKKSMKYNSVNNAYLHTWKDITNISCWASDIKVLALKTYEEKSTLRKLKLLLKDKKKFDSIFNSIKKLDVRKDEIKRITLFMECFNETNINVGLITEEVVRKAVNDAIRAIEDDFESFKGALTQETLNKIKRYSYEETLFCGLEEIENKILKKIKNILYLQQQNGDWRLEDSEYHRVIYHYLLWLVDRNVTCRHKEYRKNVKTTIPLNCFLEVLSCQVLDNRSKDYYLCQLKNKLFILCSHYCSQCKRKIDIVVIVI